MICVRNVYSIIDSKPKYKYCKENNFTQWKRFPSPLQQLGTQQQLICMSKVHICLAHCYCIMSAAISLPSYNQQYIPNILLNSHNLCSILNLFFPNKWSHSGRNKNCILYIYNAFAIWSNLNNGAPLIIN